MEDEYIKKNDILKIIDLHKSRWIEIKGDKDDNLIDNVLLVLDWIIDDIENMK